MWDVACEPEGYICIGRCAKNRAIPCADDYVSGVDTKISLFFMQCGFPLHGKCQIALAVVFQFMHLSSSIKEELKCECDTDDRHVTQRMGQ